MVEVQIQVLPWTLDSRLSTLDSQLQPEAFMQVVLLWIECGSLRVRDTSLIPSVVNRRPTISSASPGAGAGVVGPRGAIALEAARIHRLPVTDVRSTLSFYAFLVTLTFFFLYLRYRLTSLGLFMLPFVFVLTLSRSSRTRSGGWRSRRSGATAAAIRSSRTWLPR